MVGLKHLILGETSKNKIKTMYSITRNLLSLIIFAFILWTVRATYHILRGTWQAPPGVDIPLILIILLSLSCTYLLATAIERSATKITRSKTLASKSTPYESLLKSCQTYLLHPETGVDEIRIAEVKISIGLHGSLQVLKAINQLQDLIKQEASTSALKTAMIKLILAMRTELGYSNLGIGKELELFLENFKEKRTD